jgi:hypothetical protein
MGQVRLTEASPSFVPNKAAYCKHSLHPGTPQTEYLCPTCKIKQRLDPLKSVTKLWEQRGGRWALSETDPQTPESTPEEVQFWALFWKTHDVWYAGKLSLVKYVRFLELWAEREATWESQNPGKIETVNVDTTIQSASKALRIARQETPYLDWTETDDEPQVHIRTTPKKEVRKVQFADDVVERPKRSNETFRRSSPNYYPGVWSAEEGGEWFDTSFAHELKYGDWAFDEDLDEEWEIYVSVSGEEREEVREETRKTGKAEWEVLMEEWEEERSRHREIRELGADLGMICLV